MITPQTRSAWQRSSYSGHSGDNCVEIAIVRSASEAPR
ncbi:DUF397 domain-containing protein [Actinoallomurus purpureus]